MGRVFKPVEEVDLGEGSSENYLHADVKAPRMTGMLIRMFGWLMETRIIGPIAMYILKRGNLLHELFTYGHYKEPPMYFPKYPDEEINEQDVVCITPVSSPVERVNQALSCLPQHFLNDQTSSTVPFFRRWTIRDFSKAYASGSITLQWWRNTFYLLLKIPQSLILKCPFLLIIILKIF